MIYYLGVVAAVYVAFLVAQRQDREGRRQFAARLGAIYRLRSEFWRLRVWSDEARSHGDTQAAASLNSQAAEKLPEINRQTQALRRDFVDYTAEIGWLAGTPDAELRDMGEAVTVTSLVGYDPWITGKGRTPVDSVLNPKPLIEGDALSAKIHMVFGMVIGVVAGFFAWLRISANQGDGTIGMMVFYMGISALVLGYVGSQAKDSLWKALGRSLRVSRWV